MPSDAVISMICLTTGNFVVMKVEDGGDHDGMIGKRCVIHIYIYIYIYIYISQTTYITVSLLPSSAEDSKRAHVPSEFFSV